MQTYKKSFRKKGTMKKQNRKYNQKQNQNKKQNQNQKDRILKGVVCYKIRIIPRSNGGGTFEGDNFKRLEDMIKYIYKNKKQPNSVRFDNMSIYTYHSESSDSDSDSDFLYKKKIQPESVKSVRFDNFAGVDNSLLFFNFLNEILYGTTSKSKAKKQKVFNEIFNEDVFVPSDSLRDDMTIKKKNNKNRQRATKVKTLLYYLNSGKDENGDVKNKPTEDDIDILLEILKRKEKADKILTEILESLNMEAVKKKLTAGQIAAIKAKIEGTGGITSALSSVKSSIFNGAVSLGNWLVPESLDDDGSPKNLENKQKIKFLWYPRKHIDYEKGASGSKRGIADATEYGDFMIMIEPEQYASTGEFFKQTYHSVEDLLATLLMGCSKPFCLDGEVKRQPYKEYIYEITNKQPTIDRDKTGKPVLVEK